MTNKQELIDKINKKLIQNLQQTKGKIIEDVSNIFMDSIVFKFTDDTFLVLDVDFDGCRDYDNVDIEIKEDIRWVNKDIIKFIDKEYDAILKKEYEKIELENKQAMLKQLKKELGEV